VEQAQRELDDKATVDVATGLLMSNEACTTEPAPGLVSHAATQDEQTILQIAQRIIDLHDRSR
jgi:AmiR/NasT family two-component response regulator